MNRLIKSAKGITLIALVVTIIVLLILAGIAINLTIGNNGLFTRADKSIKETQIADLKERAKLDILEMKLENQREEITEEQLKRVLEKYFNDVPNKITEDTMESELASKEQYGRHKIKISEIYDGALLKDSPYVVEMAKDVLIIDENASEEHKKSPYVMYNGMLCRVLYDKNSEYGVQIITQYATEKVKIGANDESVNPEDLNANIPPYWQNNVKAAILSYNNALDKLYQLSQKYIDNSGIALKVRCVGSSPDFEADSKETFSDETKQYLVDAGLNNVFYTSSNRENIDEEILYKLQLYEGPDVRFSWLAYRKCDSSDGEVRLSIGEFPVPSGKTIVDLKDVSQAYDGEANLRLVFLLSENVKVIEGDGSNDNPYILSL